jgi:hypothetical protein
MSDSAFGSGSEKSIQSEERESLSEVCVTAPTSAPGPRFESKEDDMPQFKTDHLFKLRLLLTYERSMFLALQDTLWTEYWSSKQDFDRLREIIRIEKLEDFYHRLKRRVMREGMNQ